MSSQHRPGQRTIQASSGLPWPVIFPDAETGATSYLRELAESAPPSGWSAAGVGERCVTGKAELSTKNAPRSINHQLWVLFGLYEHACGADLGPLVNPVPAQRARHVVDLAEGFRGGFGLIPVPLHYSGTLELKLARFALMYLIALGVDQAEQNTFSRSADGARPTIRVGAIEGGGGRCFAKPVPFENDCPEGLLEVTEHLNR